VIGVCCSGDGLGGGLFAPATTDEVLGGEVVTLALDLLMSCGFWLP
jgi:hypothetical protein